MLGSHNRNHYNFCEVTESSFKLYVKSPLLPNPHFILTFLLSSFSLTLVWNDMSVTTDFF
jgi:hypothetical protein